MVNSLPRKKSRLDHRIGHNDDAAKAEAAIRVSCDEDTRILKDPAVFVAVSEPADSSVNFAVRAMGQCCDYWAYSLI